jgi:hypothetical protein
MIDVNPENVPRAPCHVKKNNKGEQSVAGKKQLRIKPLS